MRWLRVRSPTRIGWNTFVEEADMMEGYSEMKCYLESIAAVIDMDGESEAVFYMRIR